MMKTGIYSIGCDITAVTRLPLVRTVVRLKEQLRNTEVFRSMVVPIFLLLQKILEENRGIEFSPIKFMKEVQQINHVDARLYRYKTGISNNLKPIVDT